MIVLDTDYLTLLEWKGSPKAQFIYQELKARNEVLTTTIISFEEQTRGWMSYLASAKSMTKEIEAYRFLAQNLELFCGLAILPFDALAATKFQDFRRQKVRIGTMDLKIASIALAHDATVLTRNVTDFEKAPGLKIENWIE